ncbi:SRPBCC domain-containing protein [candidate division KSB1 bacterium]|nr:SRPBCC domain-containing protein [candidate division KSB1 bacterium]NIR70079.1 SRPBCC domain-containing protein [candidate division KSB1 bacterium]NIS24429.1 SRPBCC domain-containing protein [candidate division KSB1 bacterium]NIT71365.1 SRPBCC domain-containing protein [candidate division KSB1 bacterium]NIU25044.1 SRPBCC domain-containing protein [candidate division KSB1 bacterium]
MSTIRKEVTIDAPASVVWDYLTDSEKVAEWLMPNDFQAKVGKRFTFRCEPTEDWDGIVYCEVKELVPLQKLTLSWTTDQFQIETEVSITLHESKGKTKVALVHSGWDKLPPDKDFLFDNYDQGWKGYIEENLKESIEN